jgi:hypothetical protein
MNLISERAIIFSAPMVLALQSGRKTQTRRIVKPQPFEYDGAFSWKGHSWGALSGAPKTPPASPYGVAGDYLWVRETWRPVERKTDMVDGIQFAADEAFVPIANTAAAAEQWVVAANNDHSGRWRSPIHMPRWASRITLELTGVRVERLQDICWSDIRAEGIDCPEHDCPSGFCCSECPSLRHAWSVGWDNINGARASWASNPWIWALTFKRRMAGG